MSSIPELIIHIGAGKTGTTSIQFTLKRNTEELARQHFFYFGLTLEQIASATSHPWCVEGEPHRFFTYPNRDELVKDACNIIMEKLLQLSDEGVTKVIWSNEAFLTRRDRAIDIIARLSELGVPIRLICYVRRHDRWAKSGYVQFGIKFKSYNGPLQDFEEWVEKQDLSFFKHLRSWMEAFPDKLHVFNFDAIKDVTEHFLKFVGLSNIVPVRANRSPSTAVLALWAVCNNTEKGRAMPELFKSLARPSGILHPGSVSSIKPIHELLPSFSQLRSVKKQYRSDLDAVNALLVNQGQPVLEIEDADENRQSAEQIEQLDHWELERLLIQMVLSLQKQVLELQNKVHMLEEGRC